ncbi:MAG: D-alanyl-D-alanine carboxypeptidase/D-alanyl-D-alanine-endopeptidase [Rhizobacter sp.]
MRTVRARSSWLWAAAFLSPAIALAAAPLPPEAAATLAASGLPLTSFGLYVQPVDGGEDAAPLAALNAERPFLLASTTKLVTALAALDLLGPTHRWRDTTLAPRLTPADLTVAGAAPDPRTFNRGALVVSVHPGPGDKAAVTLRPRSSGVLIVNEVFMGGGCSAWAQWRDGDGSVPEVWVRGRWDAACGTRDVANLRPRAAATALQPVGLPAADLATNRPPHAARPTITTVAAAIREMNKTSDNIIARSLLLALSPRLAAGHALRDAQERIQAWLQRQGLDDDDIHVDEGSGQSHVERGKPRAMVELLRRAWSADTSRAFVDSLPVAGVDGTLSRRLRDGPAAGQAWLKTGTLSSARALAGYVRGASGTVYAVAVYVNDPGAARATPALDALIEWIARNG